MDVKMDYKRWSYYLILGLLIGILFEFNAAFFGLWVFNPPWFIIVWPFLWELLVFGNVGYFTCKLHIIIQYGISAGLGLFGELFAIFIYPIWTFPNDRVFFLQGLPVIVITFTIIWGFVIPAMTLVINAILGKE